MPSGTQVESPGAPAPEVPIALSAGAKAFGLLVILGGTYAAYSNISEGLQCLEFSATDLSALGTLALPAMARQVIEELVQEVGTYVTIGGYARFPYALAAAVVAVLAGCVLGDSIRARSWISRAALLACLLRLPISATDYLTFSGAATAVARVAFDPTPGATLAERALAARMADRTAATAKTVEHIGTGMAGAGVFGKSLIVILLWVFAGGVLGRPPKESESGATPLSDQAAEAEGAER